jgi:hypothetical protein
MKNEKEKKNWEKTKTKNKKQNKKQTNKKTKNQQTKQAKPSRPKLILWVVDTKSPDSKGPIPDF